MKMLSIKEMIKYIDMYAHEYAIVPKTNEEFEMVDKYRKEHPNEVNFCISIKDEDENNRIHNLASEKAKEEGLDDSDRFTQMMLDRYYDKSVPYDVKRYRMELVHPVNCCTELWIIDEHWLELRNYTRYLSQRLNGVKIRLFTTDLREIEIE